ncbi:MAG: hypothetical protein JW797_00110 [Bradymonadales bacterium]|nr:hypothetical protein [Bradymonadales bacterium]
MKPSSHSLRVLLFAFLLPVSLFLTSQARGEEWSQAYRHPWHLGLEAGFAGLGSDDEIVHSVLGCGGLNLTYTILPYLSVGMSHLHLATATVVDRGRWAWGLAPTVEAFWFPLSWLELVGKVGVVLQHRVGAKLDPVLGVTPFVSVGAASWVSSWFSLGLDARVLVVAGDGYLFSPRILPQGSVIGTVNLVIGFHLGSRGPSPSAPAVVPAPEPPPTALPPPQWEEPVPAELGEQAGEETGGEETAKPPEQPVEMPEEPGEETGEEQPVEMPEEPGEETGEERPGEMPEQAGEETGEEQPGEMPEEPAVESETTLEEQE